MTKPLSGPCKNCGAMFKSRGTKVRHYCSMRCYVTSDECKTRLKMIGEKGTKTAVARWAEWKPTTINCLNCKKEVRVKPGDKRKYCGSTCYRTYMAGRFDRFVAAPENIALPNNYDEFLTKDVLPCLIDGCGWSGAHLSLHMNQAHGITAAQFKKLAGFNLSSGIISKPLHEALCERDRQGVAIPVNGFFNNGKAPPQPKERYLSLEAREHAMKARALALEGNTGPVRACLGCGVNFTQSTIFGRAKFHSIECRDDFYARKIQKEKHELSCVVCGNGFSGSRQQWRSANAGSPVVCGAACRGTLNAGVKKTKHIRADHA